MHLLCINTELAFAVDNVNTSYFREQHPRCQSLCRALPCPVHIPTENTSLQEMLFLLSTFCSCPHGALASPEYNIYPSEAQAPCLLSPSTATQPLGTALCWPWSPSQVLPQIQALLRCLLTKPCSACASLHPKPILPVISSPSYHLKQPEVGSSTAKQFKGICSLD